MYRGLKSSFTKYCLLIACAFITTNSIAEKRGLIIAIGDYPAEGLWPKISSSNDIPHVKNAYETLGFDESNIIILRDKDATREGILKAFQLLELQSEAGDQIFIHFSGHGQQTIDDNGDELDGLDEAIVPYDSPLNYDEKNYKGENLITDDEINDITYSIRKKLGSSGQLIIVMDSCHSGSGTRGAGRARGTDKIMASKSFKPKSRGKDTGLDLSRDEDDMAPMASFFGASSRELNYETLDDEINPVGSLTYAFSSIISKMKNSVSFEELYDRIKLKMKTLAPNQNPQWEGPQDVYFLGGEFTNDRILYEIESVNGDKVVANVGTLGDVFEGAIIELYSIDQVKVLATGEVVKSSLINSEILLDEIVKPDKNELLKLKVVERVAAPVKCNIQYNPEKLNKWEEIISNVTKESFVNIVEANADLFVKIENDELLLEDKLGQVIFQKPYRESRDERYTFQILKVLQAYMQGDFLRKFESKSDALNLDFEIIQVDCESNSKELSSIHDSSINVGSCIKIKVKNIGTKPSFYSIIDIQPDNVINVIIPAISLGYTATEYYLEPGDEFETQYSIEVGEPIGAEVMKLIASDKPLDLSGIISNNGSMSRGMGDNHQFEKLFSSTFQGNTRGAKVTRPTIEQVGTCTKYFEIIK